MSWSVCPSTSSSAQSYKTLESPLRPAAKQSARWRRDFGRWKTSWSLVPVSQPCGRYEHRVRDLPADEPQFLSYQLPWEFTQSMRFYHRLKNSDLKAARKTEGRLADPGFFPWELRSIVSDHEILERRSLISEDRCHEVLGWEEGEYDKPYSVPVWGVYYPTPN